MCGSMVDIQSAVAEIRRGIKKEEDRKKPQGKNTMSASAMQGGHNNQLKTSRHGNLTKNAASPPHIDGLNHVCQVSPLCTPI